MSVAVARRIAARELRGGLRGFTVFLACLALGVAAIAAVGTVRSSIELGLAREGRTLLGGDAEIELTYRSATDEERAWMAAHAEAVAETVEFRSMATTGPADNPATGLTEVKAVDSAYPLYGEMRLDPPMPLADALAGAGGTPGAVMAPLLIDLLGLAPGDTFRLGVQDFVLMAAIASEPDDTGAGITVGPRTMVALPALANAGLLGPGSLYDSEYKLRLSPETDLDATRLAADEAFDGARWRDRRNGAPSMSRFVDRLGSFLVLVGLAGLAVGGVGVSAAVRAYLEEKTPVIATLKTIGADSRTIFLTYAFQIAALTAVGIVLGLILGTAVPLAFAPLIEAQLPVPAVFGLHARPVVEASIYGLLAAALFTLWPLARTQEIRAATLFRDSINRTGRPRALWIGVTLALLATLVAIASAFSGLRFLTLWAAAGITGAFVLLVAVAWIIRHLAARAARSLRGRPQLRLALGAVGGPGAETLSVILSLGLGLAVLAAVGQIDANLRGAIVRELPSRAPSFFMVDIQKDQIGPFTERMTTDPAVSRLETAPMLRGVVTEINGRNAEEVAGDHWVVRGDRGVTFAAEKPDGTTVVAGEWWPKDYAGPPQVSFAREEAEEIGLSLGDTITVDILGRPVTATITSLREVDFSTAGMGFVLTFNPAAVESAPHTWIATVYAEPEAEAAILRDTVREWPNVTAISVKDAIDRGAQILAAIASAAAWGAAATLVTGAIVLIGAAAAGVRARTYEAAILKTLGASRGAILANFALRSGLLGAAAGVVAIGAGAAGGWGVSRFVMETSYVFEPVSALAIVTGGVLATLLAGLAFAWRPLSARPAQVLRGRE